MLWARAANTAVRRRGFALTSPPPMRAETVSSLISFVKIFPRLASLAAFLCLMVLHLEWPDIERLRKTAGAHAPCFPDVSAVITGPPREQPRAHGIGTLRLGDWWSGSTAYGRSRPRLPSPHSRWRDQRRSGRPACGLLCSSQSSARRRAQDDRKEGVSMTRGGIHLG